GLNYAPRLSLSLHGEGGREATGCGGLWATRQRKRRRLFQNAAPTRLRPAGSATLPMKGGRMSCQSAFTPASASHSTILPLGMAPTFIEVIWPSLNSIRVGMPFTPIFDGTMGLSSMLTLAPVTLPASSSAICSSAGPICLQGPHHSAQKSTRTGVEDFRTSASKLSSVTFTVAMNGSPLVRYARDAVARCLSAFSGAPN